MPKPPKYLADRVRQVRAEMEGERKHITILHIDIKGSMDMAQALDQEQWYSLIEDYIQIVADGVHRFEGTMNQFTGDGVLALFGAPIAHEDHAQRACLAAIQIRDTVANYAAEVKARYGVDFGVRIGLNSGEVVIGKIGDDLSLDFAPFGHDVGLAQRMESLAQPGHICLSEYTARLVDGYFQLRDLGEVRVKGASAPIRLFDLEGLGRFRTRLDQSRARGLSAFVGRAPETAILEGALERARTSGQVVGIMAEAGAGKSRLCAEFIEHCRAEGYSVLEARGVPHGRAIPLLPMLELWRAFYGIADDDAPASAREKITRRLLAMDDTYYADLPVLFDLFGVPDPDNPSPPLDPEQRQKRIHAVVKRVMHDPSFSRPESRRIVLLEDLHWFDGASDAFLDTIVDAMPATHDLLIVNFRPEYQVRWLRRSYYQHVPLQPLGPRAVQDLLRDHLGEDPTVAGLAELIQDRTKGNPFFVEEVLQSLVESGHLQGKRPAYKLNTPLTSLNVPASVHAVLASRIDRLQEREKQVLQRAAVIGNKFDQMLLRRVLEYMSERMDLVPGRAGPERDVLQSVAALDESLSALEAAEFLFETAVWPTVEYAFKHPLTQEVAQQSLLRTRRQQVHGAVARALEASIANLDERAAEIALHWDEAGDGAQAARWHKRAAQWAGQTDPGEGLRHWRRVRALAPAVPDAAERRELLLTACQQILTLGWRAGFGETEASEVFEQGRALAEELGDRVRLAVLLGVYGVVRMSVAGSANDYVRYTVEAADIAAATGNPTLQAGIDIWPTFGYVFQGDGAKALEWSNRVLSRTGSDSALGKEVTGYSPRAAALAARTFGLMFLGRLDEAEAQGKESIRVAEAPGDEEVLGWSLHVYTWLNYLRGGTKPVLSFSRRYAALAEQLSTDLARCLAHFSLGNSHLAADEPRPARDAFLISAEIARDRGAGAAMLPVVVALLAEAHLALGERGEAEAAAREGIAAGRAGGCTYFEAQSQISLVQVLLSRAGPPPQAEIEAALDRADELLASIQGRSLMPTVLELRGRLASALGDAEAAVRYQDAALALYRAIGATGHVARLEKGGTRPADHDDVS
ncbi:ATP-binding protein [Rhodopila sp.]|jgi:adenylate cyclase|uniref:ATP-binding protein n=1 Tax=Rhodopila sp. TaxID=2480087 RepID=UPI002C854829|nr:adenylate/guanylate cyclase domain-containing protein [Rhodopila sp.]HVZ08972.1 adenylate/guanylate cyclase domain-containing protein [Rhodopila sp.]